VQRSQTRVGDRRRDDILSAASRMFRDRGYAGTTVRDLAEELGMSSGSIFHHFGSKEEILLQVVDEGVRETVQAVELARSAAPGAEPGSRLRAMIEAHLHALLEGSPTTSSVLFYEHRSLSEPTLTRLLELRDRYERVWDQALQELGGSYSDPVRRRVKRLLLLGAMNWTVQWYRSRGEVSVTDLADIVHSMFAE
jgi:AcrR family transcriptional regulator